MKKLLLFAAVLLAFAACTTENDLSQSQQYEITGEGVPNIFGIALPDDGPRTRGVADDDKLWTKAFAKNNITVKFLDLPDDPHAYVDYRIPIYVDSVKAIAKEWEKAGGVKFHFLKRGEKDANGNPKEALIRIKFGLTHEDMQCSWSYIGQDNKEMLSKQNEPTMVLGMWPQKSTVQRRNDVLRCFGQVLGLELEHRHPNFHAQWLFKVDENGNPLVDGDGKLIIDMDYIQSYWETVLAEFISWDELKSYVLDPITSQTGYYYTTDFYDQYSVMVWPFYDNILMNAKPILDDGDLNSELSADDKEFIYELYGPPMRQTPDYLPLIEFTYTGTTPSFTLTTTEDIFVIWDEPADIHTWIRMPSDTASVHKQTVTYAYNTAKERTIKIAMEIPNSTITTSYSLLEFSIIMGNAAKNIVVHNRNKALEYVKIEGGANFNSQVFNFTGFDALKQLYLVQTLDSRAVIDDCPELVSFGTSRYIWAPDGITLANNVVIKDPEIVIPIGLLKWPDAAEWNYSLSNANGTGLQISSCDRLKHISLENTRLTTLNFSNFNSLEYLYVSSTNDYICGGPNSFGQQGHYFNNMVSNLANRSGKSVGTIVVRGVPIPPPTLVLKYLPFVPVAITASNYNNIMTGAQNRNWQVIWDSGRTVPSKF